jgi:hypothetical protein
MSRSVGLHGQFLEYIYICRAIFHEIAFIGIRMPFFSKLNMKTETVRGLNSKLDIYRWQMGA